MPVSFKYYEKRPFSRKAYDWNGAASKLTKIAQVFDYRSYILKTLPGLLLPAYPEGRAAPTLLALTAGPSAMSATPKLNRAGEKNALLHEATTPMSFLRNVHKCGITSDVVLSWLQSQSSRCNTEFTFSKHDTAVRLPPMLKCQHRPMQVMLQCNLLNSAMTTNVIILK